MGLSKPDKIALEVMEETGIHCEFVSGNYSLKHNGRTMHLGALPNGKEAKMSEIVAYAKCLKENAPNNEPE